VKTSNGYIQRYSAQLVVTDEQPIAAAEVPQEQNDVGQLYPMVGRAKEGLDRAGIGKMPMVVADAGYFSEENIRRADPWSPELL